MFSRATYTTIKDTSDVIAAIGYVLGYVTKLVGKR